jgi:microcystin-dependent protein
MVLSASPTFTGAPLAPTAAPGTNTTQIATTAFALANGIPSGAILLWSGSIASIPSGWVICDGTNGTPNLRDRFVVGAGSTYAVAATGGDANAIVVTHTHTASTAIVDPGHTHTANVWYQDSSGPRNAFRASYPSVGPETATTNSAFTDITATTTVDSAGSSGTNANLPPYYALAYIMKV